MQSMVGRRGCDVSLLKEDPPEVGVTTRVEPTFEDPAETPCS